MNGNDLLDDRKSKSGNALLVPLAVGVVTLPDMGKLFGRDTVTIVPDSQPDAVILPCERDRYFIAVARMPYRIVDQIICHSFNRCVTPTTRSVSLAKYRRFWRSDGTRSYGLFIAFSSLGEPLYLFSCIFDGASYSLYRDKRTAVVEIFILW